MHYYWTYFLLPAVAASGGDVQAPLKTNAMLSGALLIAMLYLLARTAVPRAGPAAAAVWLGGAGDERRRQLLSCIRSGSAARR